MRGTGRVISWPRLDMSSDYSHLVASLDVDVDKPDEKSIMTYIAQFLKHHPDLTQSDSDGQHQEEVRISPIYRSLDMPFILYFQSACCVFGPSLQMSQLLCQTSSYDIYINVILYLLSQCCVHSWVFLNTCIYLF